MGNFSHFSYPYFIKPLFFNIKMHFIENLKNIEIKGNFGNFGNFSIFSIPDKGLRHFQKGNPKVTFGNFW